MIQIVKALSFLVSIYSIIITIRIILTWFSGMGRSRLQDYLEIVTDPYLNWFRRFTFLKVGFLDLTPIAALGVLSIVSRILTTLAYYGRITIGIILAIALQAVWGIVSFILGFLIIILILQLIAHLNRFNSNGTFWRIIDTISGPVLDRINRFLFKNRSMNYNTTLIVSIASMGVLYIVLRILVSLVSVFLARLPI